MSKTEIIETQAREIDRLMAELKHSTKANLELKAEMAILDKALKDDDGTKVTIIKPKKKQTYKKWLKQGEKNNWFIRYGGNEQITGTDLQEVTGTIAAIGKIDF